MEWIVVILIRLVVPFTILRWPLGGSILSIVADNLDVVILDLLGVTDFSDYNRIDKFLDLYFAFFQGYTLIFWKERLAKYTGIILFWYRVIGTIAFEITGLGLLLFVFPNLFEFYFVFFLLYKKIFKTNPFSGVLYIIVILFILLGLKLFQEYVLHIMQFQVYEWIAENIFSIFI